ncbi:hypothetical protein GCM10010387_17100 [Streptomyces inusitatus]|uniref:Uncharacterized protein n=1 Tax=Streptomyces inusitatus TaxID=68221 RepID=A0A918UND7_9ACTN|nr:Ig-like domain-containing protein [Streptomyces inusitatus]GGZ24324.1 hypothetical protein GCM10010387_17100 [Streptomyces inusitatus]
MSQIQYPGADTSDEPQKKRNPELGERREASYIEVETVAGSALQGKARAKLRATLTDENNEPLKGQSIRFYVRTGGQTFGTVKTDREGVAEWDTGQHISDPQLMITAAVSGYVAEYKGSANYDGAKAIGSFNVTT